MRLTFLLLSLTLVADAADYHLELAPETSKINWTLSTLLHTVHGTFKLKFGDIHFDPDTGKASGEVVVDAATGESGESRRDSRMQKSVLESLKFPQVTFAPDRVEGKVELNGTSNVRLHGSFNIHGVSHEITMPVQVRARQNHLAANAKFDVPYIEWGMKDPSTFILKVSKLVEVECTAEFTVLDGR